MAIDLDFITGSYTFRVDGQTYTRTAATQLSHSFFGFTSDTPISSFSYQSDDTTNSLIDNFSYNGAVATPEPSTYAMMLIGFVALAGLAWKRKREAEPEMTHEAAGLVGC